MPRAVPASPEALGKGAAPLEGRLAGTPAFSDHCKRPFHRGRFVVWIQSRVCGGVGGRGRGAGTLEGGPGLVHLVGRQLPASDHADLPAPEGAHRRPAAAVAARHFPCHFLPFLLRRPGWEVPFLPAKAPAEAEGAQRAWLPPSGQAGRSPFDPSLRRPRPGAVFCLTGVPPSLRGKAWALYRLGFGRESGLPPAQ